ncbi:MULTISPECIES: Fur family transcriptional regulator [unclassified Agarivorans]|uniref:Fur family transcriptional regulator n=1 Tax=unclassified Agarivorans TaxID=2636026 RepID=UPI0026E3A616|nr:MULTISPECIES: Fur family transcriptional regulator [unclassified Agarivorans]MDO6686673.1 Fur family transcriptional regulator [Agarivorans sp. 3_MG-2023]MDO6716597.1 Fur family transcriptional regulator [Agarivorans sp. 2_MG-2023]MDO6765536.1 Fur family transcriptional regulator [Agarivorans sp. 1_MG-2023]
MTRQSDQSIVDSATHRCKDSGARLTVKREQILRVLLQQQKPMSAYEILDIYNQQAEQTMPPMSVYRILEFLAQHQLVHRLESQNKFVACSHIHEQCHHQVSQFLICQNCQSVEEITIPQHLIDEIDNRAQQVGYHLLSPQLELSCLCKDCKQSQN